MAGRAVDLLVCPGQRISAVGMVESGGRRPIPDVVASSAIVPEGIVVRIVASVTRDAGRLEPRPARTMPRGRSEHGRRPTPEFGSMAVEAGDLTMLPLEWPPRAAMIELCFLAGRPLDQVEVPTGVVGMAGAAGLASHDSSVRM
ncbi:MAG: hypothetical protein ABI542_00655 [Gemmatimonadota bacterium]